jgi:hypothetical protein
MAKKRVGTTTSASESRVVEALRAAAARQRPRKTGGKKTSVRARRNVTATTPTAMFARDRGLMTAFHHMQRASVVISLMEKGTGGDLRELLRRGVKLYHLAMEDEAQENCVLCSIGVLRAAEHLALAGLYISQRKHRKKVASPTPEWLQRVMGETGRRLAEIEGAERGKGKDLYPVTEELLRQAGNPKIDAHLTFELAMAADALCFALENGL